MTTSTQPTRDMLGPKCGPDAVSIARLRRVLRTHFGEIPRLEAHLALLDSRGVLYATHVAEHFADQGSSMLFGLTRHVIRTQCPDEVPDPDVEGWLAAGRPTHDRELADTWDLLNVSRYTTDPLPETPRPATTSAAVQHVDEILRNWPDHPAHFAMAYCRLEWFIEARGVVLPRIQAD